MIFARAVVLALLLTAGGFIPGTGFAQSQKSSIPWKEPSPPFDMSKWNSRVVDGAHYFECKSPACSPPGLASYRFEPVSGAIRKAFDKEVARWIGSPGDKELLRGKQMQVFATLMTPEFFSIHAIWRQSTPERTYYGATRIVFKAAHRAQVFVTSDDLDAATANEAILSRSLELVQ